MSTTKKYSKFAPDYKYFSPDSPSALTIRPVRRWQTDPGLLAANNTLSHVLLQGGGHAEGHLAETTLGNSKYIDGIVKLID